MSPRMQLSAGAQVLTPEGDQIGSIKELADGAFQIDSSMKPDFWLSDDTVMEVEDGRVHLGVEKDHLDEFKASSPQDAQEMDAIQVLVEMHGETKAKFRKVLDSQDPQRAAEIWERLVPMLKVHEEMEETYVFGPLEEEQPSDSRLGQYEAHHHEEVEEVDSLIQQASGMDASDPQFKSLVEQIRNTLVDHIHEEENEIFPRIRENWDESRLKQAGRQMRQMKEQRLGV